MLPPQYFSLSKLTAPVSQAINHYSSPFNCLAQYQLPVPRHACTALASLSAHSHLLSPYHWAEDATGVGDSPMPTLASKGLAGVNQQPWWPLSCSQSQPSPTHPHSRTACTIHRILAGHLVWLQAHSFQFAEWEQRFPASHPWSLIPPQILLDLGSYRPSLDAWLSE
jgi:hypothetical protein